VSAGGGIVGERLFRTALAKPVPLLREPRAAAHHQPAPSCPTTSGRRLQQLAQGQPGVELVRHVPDMVAEMRSARASISQCGYNTRSTWWRGVPALVVPYETTGTENEQRGSAPQRWPRSARCSCSTGGRA
jgi:predicted glycosyltransferase